MSTFVNVAFWAAEWKIQLLIFDFSCRYFDGNLDKLFSECHVINPSKKPRIRPPINTRSSSQDMPCQICYLNFPNSVSPFVHLHSLRWAARWRLLAGHVSGQCVLDLRRWWSPAASPAFSCRSASLFLCQWKLCKSSENMKLSASCMFLEKMFLCVDRLLTHDDAPLLLPQ